MPEDPKCPDCGALLKWSPEYDFWVCSKPPGCGETFDRETLENDLGQTPLA